MAALFAHEVMEKIKHVTALPYAEQAKFYLNAFWNEGAEEEAETVWSLCEAFEKEDNVKGQQGNELNPNQALHLLQQRHQTLTTIEIKTQLQEIDIDKNGEMALAEYLLFINDRDPVKFVTNPQCDLDPAELKASEDRIEQLKLAFGSLATQKQAEADAKAAEAQAVRTEAKARDYEAAALAAEAVANEAEQVALAAEGMTFDVIIVGGSYAGLSAGMALGRSLRNILIIDGGKPCNRFTPHSHNFITQDGETPSAIAEKAKAQVMKYPTVKFHSDFAVSGKKTETGFEITTQGGSVFHAKKLIFASGIKDLLPDLPGFADCWGVSVIHCPYCHGYEVKNERTGILANGNFACHYAQMVRNLTKDLTIFTNGKADFTPEQLDKFAKHNIPVIETEVASLKHENGNIQQIVLKDNTTFDLKAVYSPPPFEQHCKIPEMLGCELTQQGHIKVDMFQKTNIAGVYACGDSTTPMRSVASAVAAGNMAGAMANNELTKEEF